MALASPLPSGVVTQRFGPSTLTVQPSMYHVGTTKAYWNPFPGAAFNANVHAGTDFAGAPAGTPLLAMEAGVVVRSTYDGINGGGNVVEVEIRPGVRYSFNHCQSRLVGVGQRVSRGQRIATIGATGTILSNGVYYRSAYGVHCHTVLTIQEKGSDGASRTMLYNVQLFMSGGSLAASALVKPLTTTVTTTYPLVAIRYPVNIRRSPDLDVDSANIGYFSRSDGIFDLAGRKRIDPGRKSFQLRATLSNDDGGWGKLFGFNEYLYVMQGLYYT
jgi:murein DD-endopeptidase MepM/ murein hydrolase activator NlpD